MNWKNLQTKIVRNLNVMVRRRALSKWLDLKGIDYIVRTGAFGNKEKHFEPHYWIETKDDEGETLIIDFKAGIMASRCASWSV